ncbi:MAG: hypothetical protein WD625_04435 [Balneolales bacterium]
MKTTLKTVFILFSLAFMASAEAKAQEAINLDLDIASRYVWRGTDFGNSPSLQPGISFAAGNLEIGGWAAFATTGSAAGSEIDWFAAYSLDLGKSGGLAFSITDYTFPDDPATNYFDSEAHFLELGAGYTGPESFPVSLTAGVFVTNDDDNSVYAEIGYPVSAFDVFVGFTPHEAEMYGTGKAGVINSGISTGREIQVSETFSFTLTSTAIMNFYDENAFFLVGISL